MKRAVLTILLIFAFGTTQLRAAVDFSSDSPAIQLELSNDNDYFQDKNFTISPNPSKDRLNIRLLKSSENTTIEVFDVLGKRVHKSNITQLESSIDVSRWKTGVYLVKISNEKESHTKRFIKQ
ncbi:MAG: T9SS type A sorting domain-containing protein [Winogradskyella sp.]|uniref:T9SS type A sorting domain-containing protein n=1 Tax=Winogradskyella sp. TaxID=1883156 RepID=UPI00385B24E3